MKPNFTSLRICLFVSFFSLSFANTFAQSAQAENPGVISNLKASVQNSNLVINWNAADNGTANHIEIQASEDGKTFSTIGLVLGADPKQANTYTFKQNVSKLKPGRTYYRVLTVDTNSMASASDVVRLTK